MAVSGKTAPHELPYFLDSDKPPNMATVTKAIADRVEALLAKGGDVSIAADGTVTIGAKKVTNGMLADDVVTAAKIAPDAVGSSEIAAGAVGESELGAGAVTRAKVANGSFKTARVSTGEVAGGASAFVTVPWGSEFADTNYTVSALVQLGLGSSAVGLIVQRVDAVEKGQIKLIVKNEAGSARTGTLHAMAWHD